MSKLYFLILWLVIPIDRIQANILDDEELSIRGANITLQIIADIDNNAKSYGSALIWEKTKEHLIIATAYHVLQGAKKFEVWSPHLDKTGDFKLSSTVFGDGVYADRNRDLVIIKLKLTDEVQQKYSWLSELQEIQEKCSLSKEAKSSENKKFTKSRVFGFPQFYQNKSDIYAPEVTLGREGHTGKGISNKYLKPEANMRILHLGLNPTDKGMSGGPVLDTTGCIRGMLIGRLPDLLGLAVSRDDIYQAVNHTTFKPFNKENFTKKSVWTEEAISQFASDMHINDISWKNAKDWGLFFDDPSIFIKSFLETHIDLEHYRIQDKENQKDINCTQDKANNDNSCTQLKLYNMSYGKVGVNINGQSLKDKWKNDVIDLTDYLRCGQNHIIVDQQLRENIHQIFVNDLLYSNQIRLAFELNGNRIYNLNRELPAAISHRYSFHIYLHVDKLESNECLEQEKGKNNGLIAVSLDSLHKKLFSEPVKFPLSFHDRKKQYFDLRTCLTVKQKASENLELPSHSNCEEQNSSEISISELVDCRSRCRGVCVNEKFGYVDFGIFGELEVQKATACIGNYAPRLVNGRKDVEETEDVACKNGVQDDNSFKPFNIPLHYETRLEFLNKAQNKGTAWTLRGITADFLPNSTWVSLGNTNTSSFYAKETDFYINLTPFLPAILMSEFNNRLDRKPQLFNKWYLQRMLDKSNIEENESNKLPVWLDLLSLETTIAELISLEYKTEENKAKKTNWLRLGLQLGESNDIKSRPKDIVDLHNKYGEADILMDLRTNKISLSHLLPKKLSNQIWLDTLSLKNSHLQVALTLPFVKDIVKDLDYCDNENKETSEDIYRTLLKQLFKKSTIQLKFDIKSGKFDGISLKGAVSLEYKDKITKNFDDILIKFEDIEIAVNNLSNNKFQLKNATLSISTLNLYGAENKTFTGNGKGKIEIKKDGLIKLGMYTIEEIPKEGIPFTIVFDEQSTKFDIEYSIPLISIFDDNPLFSKKTTRLIFSKDGTPTIETIQ